MKCNIRILPPTGDLYFQLIKTLSSNQTHNILLWKKIVSFIQSPVHIEQNREYAFMNLFHQLIVTFDKEAHLINGMTASNEK